MNLKPQFGFIVEYVTDIEAAQRFFVDVLGLKVERYHPAFIQFDHFAIASDESLSGTRAPEMYWLVDDAEAALAELSQTTEISIPLTQKPFGKVFAVKDPTGQLCFLLEFARNRPSQPTT